MVLVNVCCLLYIAILSTVETLVYNIEKRSVIICMCHQYAYLLEKTMFFFTAFKCVHFL